MLTVLFLQPGLEINLEICRDCLRSFDDDQEQDYDPARKLGNIYLESAGATGDDDLCPECRKKTSGIDKPQ
jgi:hypothetical protein